MMGNAAETLDLIKCKFCAEIIQPEATICRHCHHDLVEMDYKTLNVIGEWVANQKIKAMTAKGWTFVGDEHNQSMFYFGKKMKFKRPKTKGGKLIFLSHDHPSRHVKNQGNKPNKFVIGFGVLMLFALIGKFQPKREINTTESTIAVQARDDHQSATVPAITVPVVTGASQPLQGKIEVATPEEKNVNKAEQYRTYITRLEAWMAEMNEFDSLATLSSAETDKGKQDSAQLYIDVEMAVKRMLENMRGRPEHLDDDTRKLNELIDGTYYMRRAAWKNLLVYLESKNVKDKAIFRTEMTKSQSAMTLVIAQLELIKRKSKQLDSH